MNDDDPVGPVLFALSQAIRDVFEAFGAGYGAQLRADWPVQDLRDLDRLRGAIEVPFLEAAE